MMTDGNGMPSDPIVTLVMGVHLLWGGGDGIDMCSCCEQWKAVMPVMMGVAVKFDIEDLRMENKGFPNR